MSRAFHLFISFICAHCEKERRKAYLLVVDVGAKHSQLIYCNCRAFATKDFRTDLHCFRFQRSIFDGNHSSEFIIIIAQ